MEKNICLSCGGYFNPEEIVETVCIYCLAYERMPKEKGKDSDRREKQRLSKRAYRERIRKETIFPPGEEKRHSRCKYNLREEGQIFIAVLLGMPVEKCAVMAKLSPKTVKRIITYWQEKFNERWPVKESKPPKRIGFPL